MQGSGLGVSRELEMLDTAPFWGDLRDHKPRDR